MTFFFLMNIRFGGGSLDQESDQKHQILGFSSPPASGPHIESDRRLLWESPPWRPVCVVCGLGVRVRILRSPQGPRRERLLADNERLHIIRTGGPAVPLGTTACAEGGVEVSSVSLVGGRGRADGTFHLRRHLKRPAWSFQVRRRGRVRPCLFPCACLSCPFVAGRRGEGCIARIPVSEGCADGRAVRVGFPVSFVRCLVRVVCSCIVRPVGVPWGWWSLRCAQ